MKATQKLHDLGQSLWLDNITRDLLNSGTLRGYIDELSVTGLTSNPTIFDHAIKNSTAYDGAIRQKLKRRQIGRGTVLRTGAGGPHSGRRSVPADPRADRRRGRLGVAGSVAACWPTTRPARWPRPRICMPGRTRPNLFIKIPGTKEGLPAIEEAIFAGIPINVTLLFSREQYVAAAEAFLRGIERRIDAGLNPDVGSVASVFISRWDAAVMGQGPGVAARPARHRHRQNAPTRHTATCWLRRAGSVSSTPARRPQRLLWASTGTKDPKASDVLYIKALAAPFTVNTMPEGTLKALADHGEIGQMLPADGGDCEDGVGAVRQGRNRRRCSGRPAPGRRGQVVRQVLERTDGGDRLQERRAQEGRLEPPFARELQSDFRETVNQKE